MYWLYTDSKIQNAERIFKMN